MQCISKKLIERYCLIEQAKTRRYVPRENVDLKQIYESLATDKSFLEHDTSILYTTSHPNHDIAEEVLYITCTNPEVRKLAKWCNKNLLATVTTKTRPTHMVLIRIATGMLNNLNLPQDISNFIHDNIVQNTYGAELDYSVSDLPF